MRALLNLQIIRFSLLLLSIVVLFQACSGNTSKQNSLDNNGAAKATKASPEFKEFLKKFKVLSLPLTIRTLEIVADSSKKLNYKDNTFIKSDYPDEIYAYGMLPDTGSSYKIIWLEPAEVEIPVLTTFTKDGQKISQEELGVGGCGTDCGFNCLESVTIDKKFTIFSCDSIKSTNCDTSGNPIENTTKKYLRFKEGKISKNGKIVMTQVQKKSI